MILLDTDHITLVQNGGAQALSIVRRLTERNVKTLATSIITYEEQVRGWMAELSRSKSIHNEIQIYARLHAQLRFFSALLIVDFDEVAATQFQRLRALNFESEPWI